MPAPARTLRSTPWLALLAAAACTPARPALDPALTREERLAVQGRDGWRIGQRVRFGEFEAGDVARDATRGGDASRTTATATRQTSRRRQQFRFALRGGTDTAPAFRGRCDVTLRARDRLLGSGVSVSEGYRQAVDCALDAADGARWRLALAETDTTRMGGSLAREDGQGPPFVVRPVARFEGTRLETARAVAWEFVLDGRALGAVAQTNGGSVVLPRRYGDEVRRTLAAASAALLLYDVLEAPATEP
jgi:hypothetical protein